MNAAGAAAGDAEAPAERVPEQVLERVSEQVLERVSEQVQDARVRVEGRRRPAVFLDRDGVLNRDAWPTVLDPSELQLLPGSAEAVAMLTHAGWPVFVCTNKTAMGWRLLSPAAHVAVMALVLEGITNAGGAVLEVYHCPHTGFRCDCHKPRPGMLLRAAREHHLDLSRSWMVGDSWRDVAAGKAAGCRTILVGPGSARAMSLDPYAHVHDLRTAAELILEVTAKEGKIR